MWLLLMVMMTVFRGQRNFEPSREICLFLQNFYVYIEFCGIWYWLVISDIINQAIDGAISDALKVYLANIEIVKVYSLICII